VEREVGGSGGGIPPAPGVASSVCISVCQLPHRIFGGGVRKTHDLEMRQQFETKCNERSELHAGWGRGWSPLPRFGGSGGTSNWGRGREPPPAVRRGIK